VDTCRTVKGGPTTTCLLICILRHGKHVKVLEETG
jgi:hypothetical protein